MAEPIPGKLSAGTISELQNLGFIPKRKPRIQTEMIISCLTCPFRRTDKAYGYGIAGCTKLSPETVYPALKRFRTAGMLTNVRLEASREGSPQVVYTISPLLKAAVNNPQSLPRCQSR